MQPKTVVIGASWFQEASFCEQKLYLSKVKKLPLVETEAMAKGGLIHEEKYEDFIKSAAPTTWEEFFKSEEGRAQLATLKAARGNFRAFEESKRKEKTKKRK